MDPYGFEEPAAPRAVRRSGGGRLLAGAQILILGLCSSGCAACAGWLIAATKDEQSGDITFLVWMLFSLPAWPFAGWVLATIFLRSTIRKWWAVAGPNMVVGAGGGCIFWAVVFLTVFSVSVIRGVTGF